MKLLLILSLLSPLVTMAEVTVFKSNGCTLFPDGTPAQPRKWHHCCVEHDLFFWAGGTIADRDLADIGLRDCVAMTGERNLSRVIYNGVRAGHHSPIRLGKEGFGNAWHGTRVPRTKLTEAETMEIIQALELQASPQVTPTLFQKFKTVLMARLLQLGF